MASLWTEWVARSVGVRLPWTEPLSMFVAVWLLYAADRLLDARAGSGGAGLEARHLFHRRHAAGFRVGIGVASLALTCLVTRMPGPELARFSLLGALLAGWFVVIHISFPAGARGLPKELGVGVFFAAAVWLPAAVRSHGAVLMLTRETVLFGVLCWLNCVFIFAWEHAGEARRAGHRSTRFAAEHRVLAAVGLMVVAGFAGAGLIWSAALLLLAADWFGDRVEPTTLRALADLALVLPAALAGLWLR